MRKYLKEYICQMEHIAFKERPLWIRAISVITILLFVLAAIIVFAKYEIYKHEEEEEYQKIKVNSRHIKIDDISGSEVYMIIYKGDTLGVVTANNK